MIIDSTNPTTPSPSIADWTAGPAKKPGRHNPLVPDIPPEPAARVTDFGQQSFWDFSTGPEPDGAPVAAARPRGKIGQTVFQGINPWPKPRTPSQRNLLQRRRMVIPYDPRTDAQLLQRARFGRAVRAWHALTGPERSVYHVLGHAQDAQLEGLNVWIRDFCIAHPLEEFTEDAEYLKTHGSLPPEE